MPYRLGGLRCSTGTFSDAVASPADLGVGRTAGVEGCEVICATPAPVSPPLAELSEAAETAGAGAEWLAGTIGLESSITLASFFAGYMAAASFKAVTSLPDSAGSR